ncbi:MAG: hypothetical protein JNK75_05620 [Betaproteobacteria bacterium]|nr:hypothetical protein [Betaproteobacteria bacterium]
MPDTGRRTWPIGARVALQLVVLLAFAALLGFGSRAPALRLRGDGEALIKLSFSHAAPLKHACRERSAEELARLAPNMRTKMDCPRERSPVTVELDLDGTTLYRIGLAPGGLHKDGAATVYRRMAVPAGRHTLAARLSDQAGGAFNHRKDAQVDLAPGQVLLIDFLPAEGGFVFSKG